MKRMRSVWVIGLAVLAFGCSDGGVPRESAPDSTFSRDELSTELAEWLCDAFASCCQEVGVQFDRSQCVETRKAAKLRGWDEHYLSDATAAQCLEEILSSAPSCQAPYRSIPSCYRLLDGTLEVGEPCESKTQCRGYRAGAVGCLEGRCAERGAIGADCTRPDAAGTGVLCDQCQRGAVCHWDEGRGQATCVENEASLDRGTGEEGEFCPSPHVSCSLPERFCRAPAGSCKGGLFCSPSADPLGRGVCEPRRRIGGACSKLDSCESGLVCDGGTCIVPSRTAGEPCSFDVECASGLRCSQRANGQQECIPGAVGGESCGFGLDDQKCARGLLCGGEPGNHRCTTPEEAWCAKATR